MRSTTSAAGSLALALLGQALIGIAPSAAQVNDRDLVPCVAEGQICRMPYPTNVFYGIPGKLVGRPFPNGGAVPCNNASFGDPAPGRPKHCFIARRISDSRPAGGGGGGYRGDEMRRPPPPGRDRFYDEPRPREPYGFGRERRRFDRFDDE